CFKDNVGAAAHKELLFNKNPSLIARMLNLRGVLGKTYRPIYVKACYRKFIETLKGFDPSFGYFVDWELGVRIENEGYKVVWTKGKIWHEEISKFNRLIKQCRWMGKSITFKKYKANATKKLLYSLVCTGLPIFFLLLFLRFPFWILGTMGILSFLAIELYRTSKIFFNSRKLESLLTPFFDYISMTFVFLGFIDKLFGKGVKR
ncbi:MAG: glycosyltransferase family 2 protein, partial [Methanosarcinales archaeon]